MIRENYKERKTESEAEKLEAVEIHLMVGLRQKTREKQEKKQIQVFMWIEAFISLK